MNFTKNIISKFWIFTVSIAFGSNSIYSQNLIVNHSFEETNGQLPCSWTTGNQFDTLMNSWFSPLLTTPNVHSLLVNEACWASAYPNFYTGLGCDAGEEVPHSGDVMAGISCSGANGVNWKEYLETRLSTPMTLGQSYYIEFHISLAESSSLTTSSIGIYFSDSLVTGIDSSLNFIPQFSIKNYSVGDNGWTKVHTVLTATSQWEYLVIGSFNRTDSTNYSSHSGCQEAYYFIDDVIVRQNQVNSSKDIFEHEYLTLYPNPNSGEFTVFNSGSKKLNYSIINIAGQELAIGELRIGRNDIKLKTENKGIYLLKTTNATVRFYKD